MAAPARGAPADEPSPDAGASPSDSEVRDRVAEWLRDLRSDAYEVRERARAGLLLHGARARDLLEARRDDEDPEVRGTVRSVLDRLTPGASTPAAAGPVVEVSGLGLVTMDNRGPLEGILRRLGQLHEGSFGLPSGFRAKEAEVHVSSEPLFRILDVLGAVVGLDASAPFDPSGTLGLREPREGTEPVPTAYDGPFRARIVRVTSVRTLGNVTPSRTSSFALQIQWSPAIQVVSLEGPRVEEVEDAAGHALRPPAPTGGVVQYGLGSTSTSIEVSLSFQPGPPLEPGDRLARLAVVAPLRLRHARKWVSFRRLEEGARTIEVAPETTGGPKGGTVALRRFEAPEEGPGGAWTVEVLAQLDTEVARESVRAFLEDADGSVAALGLSARSVSADGTVELLGRGRPPSGAAPAGVRVAWFSAEGKGEARFRFEGVPTR